MSFSMDDLLKKADSNSQEKARREQERQAGLDRVAAFKKRSEDLVVQLLEAFKETVAEFNARSETGEIRLQAKAAGSTWEIVIPHGSPLMLERAELSGPVQIKNQHCLARADFFDGRNGRTVMFLYLQNPDGGNGAWNAARAKQSPLVPQNNRKIEPFSITMEEIERATSCMDVVQVSFSADLPEAFREMIGYALSPASS